MICDDRIQRMAMVVQDLKKVGIIADHEPVKS